MKHVKPLLSTGHDEGFGWRFVDVAFAPLMFAEEQIYNLIGQ